MELLTGDELVIESGLNDRKIFGTFIRQDEDSIMVRKTLGDGMGNLFIIPKGRIWTIEILKGGDDTC